MILREYLTLWAEERAATQRVAVASMELKRAHKDADEIRVRLHGVWVKIRARP